MNKEALLEKAEREEEELERDLQSGDEDGDGDGDGDGGDEDGDEDGDGDEDDSGDESDTDNESDTDTDNDNDEVPASVRRQRWFSDPMFSNLEGESSSEDESPRRSEKRERPLAERLRAYSRCVGRE